MATDLESAILSRIGSLPAAAQERVLAYINSLVPPSPGSKGATLLSFAGTLDPSSVLQMLDAIESGCEVVDPGEW
jgi:hypothetical protein